MNGDGFKEFEVDKALGIKGPKDVEAMGIDKYNAQCRSIVMRHAHEWEVSGVCSRGRGGALNYSGVR